MPKAQVSVLEVEIEASASSALAALDKLEEKLNRVGSVLDEIVKSTKAIKEIGDMAQSFKGVVTALNAARKAQQDIAKHKNDGKVNNKDLLDRKRILQDIGKLSATRLLGMKDNQFAASGKQLPALLPPSYRDMTKMLPALYSKMLPAVYGGKQLPAVFNGAIGDTGAAMRRMMHQVTGMSFADLMGKDGKNVFSEIADGTKESALQLPAIVNNTKVIDAEWREVKESVNEASAAATEFQEKTRDSTLFGTKPRNHEKVRLKEAWGSTANSKYLFNDAAPKSGSWYDAYSGIPGFDKLVGTKNGVRGDWRRVETSGVKAYGGIEMRQKIENAKAAAEAAVEQAYAEKQVGEAAKESAGKVEELNNATNDMEKKSKSASDSLKKTANFFKTLGKTLGNIGKALGIGGGGHGSKLFGRRGFGGFLSLMVIRRALTSLIRTLTAGIKEGSDNLTQYSSEYNNSISRMVSGLNYLKNAWAAAFAPIVNVVAPYVETFINLLASALNAIGRFMAALTGKGFAVQAKSVWTDYAASLDKAGSSAGGAGSKMDDLKKTIMSFDEIHALNDPNSSGGGGGGGAGGGGINPSDMFETVDLAGDSLAGFAQELREKILNDDWYGVGAAIAEKMNKAIEKANDSDWAATLATKLNNAVEAYNGWVDTFNWTGLGSALGKSVNDFFLTFSWSRSAAGIAKTINGLLSTFISFAKTVKWEKIGSTIVEAIGTFFENLNWNTIGEALRVAFLALIKFANGILDEVHIDDIALYAARAIINGLVGFFSGDNPELVQALTKCIKNMIVTAFQVMTPWLALLNGFLKEKFGIDILGGINQQFDEWIEEAFPDADKKVHGGAGGVLDNLDTQVNEEYGKTNDKAVKKTEETVSKTERKWSPFSGWFKSNVNSPLTGHATTINTNLTTAFATAAANATAKWSGISTWFDTNVKTPIYTTFNTLATNIGNAFTSAKTNLTSGWGSVSGWFESHVRVPIANMFGTFKSIGETAASNLRAGLKSISSMPTFHFSWNIEKKVVSLFGHQIVASVPWPKISFYAQGGFPSADLFAANEVGNPEMVGRIGNRTAVANNNQITEALKNAMLEGLMQYAMAMNSSKDSTPYQINLVIKTQNDEVLARAVERGNAKRHSRMYPAGAVR